VTTPKNYSKKSVLRGKIELEIIQGLNLLGLAEKILFMEKVDWFGID